MKYFIITFFFISFFSGYNCQLIERFEQTAESVNVTWFKDMVKLMIKQLKGRQLNDMPLSPFAPYNDVIGSLINSLNITKITCIKMFTPPNSTVIDEIEVEVLKTNNESNVIQISTYNNTLAVVIKKIKTKVKEVEDLKTNNGSNVIQISTYNNTSAVVTKTIETKVKEVEKLKEIKKVEVKKIEEAKKIEELKKLKEVKKIEAKKSEELQKLKEVNKIEEAKKIEDLQKLKEVKKIEANKIEDLRKLNDVEEKKVV